MFCTYLYISAVVLDRDFLAEEYDKIKEAFESYLVYAKREVLKHGGVNVLFYSWTAINVKRGKTLCFPLVKQRSNSNNFRLNCCYKRSIL